MKRLVLKRLVLVPVLVIALALAPAGAGSIAPQRGMGGVSLGMSQAVVKAKLGKPRRIERGSSELGTYTTFRYLTLSVTFFAGPTATSIATASTRQRTTGGVGVGSTRAEVAARVAGARCIREFGYDHCYVGTWKPGKVVTDFALQDGRVKRITIGYVID